MTDEDGEPVRGMTADGLQMLCFRLGIITHTSVEYYMDLPYKDLVMFVAELQEQSERRERAAQKRRRKR